MSCVIPILAYHKVDSQKELGITSISPTKFEKQIKFLKQNGYSGLSPHSLFCLPKNIDKQILITFDDGYDGIYRHVYPTLKKYDFTAIVFLTTGYIGNYNLWDPSPGPRFKHLNWNQIKEMSDNGIWFGSHSINHLFLTRHSDSTIKYELEASKKHLEDGLGKPIHFFSYPYGNYDNRVVDLVGEVGYHSAFSLDPRLLILPDGLENLKYKLPRLAIYYIDSMFAFKTKIGDVNTKSLFYMQQMKNRLINKCSHAGMIVEKLRLLNKRK